MPVDQTLHATSRCLTLTLFIGQGFALVALFTTVAKGCPLATSSALSAARWPGVALLLKSFPLFLVVMALRPLRLCGEF